MNPYDGNQPFFRTYQPYPFYPFLPWTAEKPRDKRRFQELYPSLARQIQPLVEEACDRMEYEGSLMFDEYPDRLSLLRQAKSVWEEARAQENFEEPEPKWEQLQDLIGVLLLQEMLRRRKKNRSGWR